MSARTEIILHQNRVLPLAGKVRRKNIHGKIVTDRGIGGPILFLLILHIPLGVLMYNFGALGIVHPTAVFALGLYFAIQRSEPLERVAYVVAYIIGVEVLLRMAGAPVYWEFGKYASAALMIIALARRGLFQIPGPALLYLLLLLPACLVTIMVSDWQVGRGRLSFNMSGPICLFVSCWFFSQIKLTPGQLRKLFLLIAVPLVSVAVATLFFTVSSPYLEFTNESNRMTSGGFGPNQVSSMLGLGAFLATASFILFKNDVRTSILLGVLTLLFAAQSVLTFSRGGMYAAIGALVFLVIFQAGNFRQLLGRFVPVLAVAAIFLFIIFPALNDFTGGKLEERFESSDTTNRLDIMALELQIFAENPLFGAGVGEAIDERYDMSRHFSASHTEFTRLLSEHGTLGMLAILSLIAATVQNLRKQSFGLGRALVVGSVIWSGLFMANSGMRLAAPAFMWGLSFAMIINSIHPRLGSSRRLQRVRSRLGSTKLQDGPSPESGESP